MGERAIMEVIPMRKALYLIFAVIALCVASCSGSASRYNKELWGQRRSSVAGLTEDDRQTVDKERQVGDPMQLRTEVLNL